MAVHVTSNRPKMDALVREQFGDLGVAFKERQISSYHIFYDLSRKVTPEEMTLDRDVEP